MVLKSSHDALQYSPLIFCFEPPNKFCLLQFNKTFSTGCWLHICPTFGNWINNTIKRWNPCNDLKCLKWKNEHSINDQLTDCKISLFWQLLLYIIVHKAFVVTFVTLLYIFNVLVLMPWYLLPSCKTLPSFFHWKWRSSPDASTVRVVDAPVATNLLSGCWGKSLSGKYQL